MTPIFLHYTWGIYGCWLTEELALVSNNFSACLKCTVSAVTLKNIIHFSRKHLLHQQLQPKQSGNPIRPVRTGPCLGYLRAEVLDVI